MTQLATFGGGCFWCTEAVFSLVKGVLKVEPGYSGGHVPNPTYELVCTGTTGHAEVVQITFDPNEVTYDELLDVFFATHDPTTPNRQDYDVGPQYRSVIFYHSEEQKTKALEKIRKLEEAKVYPKPVVTQVEPFKSFYPAEEYHKRFYFKNTSNPYCVFVIAPKIVKLKKLFPNLTLGIKF
jgi:peptide-methionine (S)-S-oxide reductase